MRLGRHRDRHGIDAPEHLGRVVLHGAFTSPPISRARDSLMSTMPTSSTPGSSARIRA